MVLPRKDVKAEDFPYDPSMVRDHDVARAFSPYRMRCGSDIQTRYQSLIVSDAFRAGYQAGHSNGYRSGYEARQEEVQGLLRDGAETEPGAFKEEDFH